MQNRVLRQLSTFERFFWLHNQIEPVHFAVAALAEGATTVNAWRAGLSSLQHRHPFLMASIGADANAAPCFISRPGVPIPLRVVPGNVLQRLDTEVARELSTAFRDGDALLVRAVLLHEEQRSIVMLVAHHSIADALSLVYAIRDLLQLLSGEKLAPLPVPPSHEALLGLEEDVIGERGGGAFETDAPLNRKFQELVPRVTSLRMTRELTSNLQKISRQEKTSVQGALASSVVFAMRELVKRESPAPVRLASPISTRKQLNQSDDCVVLTDTGILDLDIPASGDFWELARRVKSELSPQTSLPSIAERRRAFQQVLANVFDAEGTLELARRGMNVDFVLTNLGNLSVERQYGRLRLEALWPAILIGTSENRHVLGVATVGGRLSLMYCSYTPIPHLLETMESLLTEACTKQMLAHPVGAV
jgi:Phthiocerol/phthiodiolone dimycocerosyl transferase C-terminus